MSQTLISVLALAFLFALAGALRIRVGCGGKCSGCASAGACESSKSSEQHV